MHDLFALSNAENQIFLRGRLRQVFLYLILFLEEKMQLIVFSCVSWGTF